MAKNFYLRFLLNNQDDDLVVEVREFVSDRLRSILDRHDENTGEAKFFWFDSVDGQSYALNLAALQAVHFLWEPAVAASDSVRYEGRINLMFRGRSNPHEAYTDAPDQLYDFFSSLEHGPDVVAYPAFEDEDGELIQVNPLELVWVSAPAHLLTAGRAKIESDGRNDF